MADFGPESDFEHESSSETSPYIGLCSEVFVAEESPGYPLKKT